MSIEQSGPAARSRWLSLGSIHRLPFLIMLCIAWLILVLVVALGADYLAPFAYTEQSPQPSEAAGIPRRRSKVSAWYGRPRS